MSFYIWEYYCLLIVLFSFVCVKIFFSLCLFFSLCFLLPHMSPSPSSQWGCGDTFWAVLGVNYSRKFHGGVSIPKIWCTLLNLVCFVRRTHTAFLFCSEFLKLVKYWCHEQGLFVSLIKCQRACLLNQCKGVVLGWAWKWMLMEKKLMIACY